MQYHPVQNDLPLGIFDLTKQLLLLPVVLGAYILYLVSRLFIFHSELLDKLPHVLQFLLERLIVLLNEHHFLLLPQPGLHHLLLPLLLLLQLNLKLPVGLHLLLLRLHDLLIPHVLESIFKLLDALFKGLLEFALLLQCLQVLLAQRSSLLR